MSPVRCNIPNPILLLFPDINNRCSFHLIGRIFICKCIPIFRITVGLIIIPSIFRNIHELKQEESDRHNDRNCEKISL